MENFSVRLKSLRKERGLKQKDMSDFLSLSPRGYQCYEYNEGYPDVPGLIKLADFFDVSLDYLVGRSEVRQRQ